MERPILTVLAEDEADIPADAYRKIRKFLRLVPAYYDREYGWLPVWEKLLHNPEDEKRPYLAAVPYEMIDIDDRIMLATKHHCNICGGIIMWLPNRDDLPSPTFEQYLYVAPRGKKIKGRTDSMFSRF